MRSEKFTHSARQTFREFTGRHRWINWLLVLLPMQLLQALLTAFNAPAFVRNLATSFFVVYTIRLALTVHKTRQTPRLWQNFKNLNYLRDILGVLLADLPTYLFGLIVGFFANRLVNQTSLVAELQAYLLNPSNVGLRNVFFEYSKIAGDIMTLTIIAFVVYVILFLFVLIPLSGTPYLLARDSSESYKFSFKDIFSKMKTSFQVFKRWDYKWQIIKINLIVLLYVFVVALVMLIPFAGIIIAVFLSIYMSAFFRFYETDLYVKIFANEGIDLRTYIK